jgi:hypothetical protein
LDGNFQNTVDDLERGEKDLAVEVEFEYSIDNKLDLMFFLIMTGLDVPLLILIFLFIIVKLDGIVSGKQKNYLLH